MRILIDGYNVLHAVGILARNVGPGTLQRARTALLGVLARSLDEADRLATTVVFDSGDPPPGLPRQTSYRGITVHFATEHEDADALITELIRSCSAPRQLTVVSSDHQIQRAGKRRRAIAVDSDVWFDELVRRRPQPDDAADHEERFTPNEGESELARWQEIFGTAFRDAEIADPDGFDPFPPGYANDVLTEGEDD